MTARVLVSLAPILLFLAALMYLDSFKLVGFRRILITIGLGGLTALAALAINLRLLSLTGIDLFWYTRLLAPVIEELLKASVVIYFILSKRVGFMVDAALYGVAVGAGFALVENIYYLSIFNERNILLWLIRGFGTAMMHGGATAIVGIVARSLYDRYSPNHVMVFLPGMLIAMVFHSLFNHFILSPVLSTVLIIIVLPVLMMAVFKRSEDATRTWLGTGLDSDLEVLNLLTIENLPDSRIGRYLQSLRSRFPSLVIGDMLCYIRLYTELSMRAKGILMMRQAGFTPARDPDLAAMFTEIQYLKNTIGKTGMLAIAPILHANSRSLWQLSILMKQ